MSLRNAMFAFALCGLGIGSALAQNAAPAPQAARPAQGLDRLLDQIREGSQQMSKTNQEREARFLRDKNQQAQLLAEAEGARNAADARAKQAKARYDGAQAGIAALKQQLQGRVGDSSQIFSAVSDAAGALKAQAQDSLVTPQLPTRSAELDQLAQARELPGVDQIEKLWFLYAQEIAENGKVARFKAQVFDDTGQPRQAEVTRIGAFTAFADGRYLAIEPGTGQLTALPRQPSDFTGLIRSFGKDADDQIRDILVDPSRGALLRLAAERPALSERIHQAGAVGYVIIAIGLVGAALAIHQLVYLLLVGRKVGAQLRDLGRPRDDNPLGRVLGCLRGESPDSLRALDTEAIETRLAEAVLRETPKLERYQALLRMIVAAGPLLGLLGTVVGMIMTFQVITELGSGDPKVMAGGISHAMVATVLGLLIAIPLLFANSFLGARSRVLTQILDEQAAGMLARQLEARRSRNADA
ncbi:MotA/TolQ/ExbB proton channel family protein [Hydrocarboniphaga effusa]|uniref:MotA/TolQ/ExbB proton channel family protein n=1 Tax=Hydrocarboniphaga effusa TaxID=243629 RepID=UPI003137D6E1